MAMFEMMSRSSVGDGGTDVHWVAGDLLSKLCVILCVGPQAQAGLGKTELQKWRSEKFTH